jgi:hypothetical protein
MTYMSFGGCPSPRLFNSVVGFRSKTRHTRCSRFRFTTANDYPSGRILGPGLGAASRLGMGGPPHDHHQGEASF